jgi:hypothetical protein
MLLLRVFLPVLSVALLWIFAGSRIASLLDRLSTHGETAMEASPLSLTTQRFCLGEQCYFVPEGLGFAPGPENQLQLSWQGQSFLLGPIQSCAGDYYQFQAAPGDQVRFTQSYSHLPWPTPFEFSLFSLATTSWRRHSYRRLEWKKPNGTQLTVIWPDQQGYYKKGGWSFDNRPFPPTIQVTQL